MIAQMKILWLALLFAVLTGCSSVKNCYQPCDSIDRDVFVEHANGEKVLLRELFHDSKLLCLVLIGGAHGKGAPEKGDLWCEDSFRELPLYEGLQKHFRDKPVRFVAVACPPVYSDGGYGEARKKFFDSELDSPIYRESREQFVQRTEQLKLNGVLPFQEIYYDTRFRLLRNPRKPAPLAGNSYSWEGRFKWSEDMQNYGTPTIWLISSQGVVQGEPFWGNQYPNVIRYGVGQIIQAIENNLTSKANESDSSESSRNRS